MSSVAAALAPLAKEKAVPIFSIGATEAPVLDNPYFFVTYIAAGQQASLYNDFLNNPASLTVFHQNDEYGRSVSKQLSELRAGKHDRHLSFEATSSAKNLAAKGATGSEQIVIVGFGAILGDLVQELRTAGFVGPILLSAEAILPPNPEVILPQKK